MSKRYKPGTYYAKGIRDIIRDMNKAGIKDLQDIQEYLINERGLPASSRLHNAILAVVSAKTKEKKIYFKSDTFSKQLRLYLPVGNKTLKTLTNDVLYFEMLKTRFLADSDINEGDKRLITDGKLVNITFASDNFTYTQKGILGYIQDFDADFSCICSEEFKDSQELLDVVNEKPNRGGFDIGGDEFIFFGNEDVCIVCRANMDNEAIVAKAKNMKYMRATENGFTSGIRSVGPSIQIKYIYKEIEPEDFCPSFLMLPQSVSSAFLIEVLLDYNDLFEYLQNDGKVIYPANMCYWDTLQACMDFLSVFSLTANIAFEERSLIGGWVDEYYTLKSGLVKVKTCHTKVEQCLHEYLNTFLNNSDVTRFKNLLEKCIKCLNEYTNLKKEGFYHDCIGFLSKLPFCQMIQNQLKVDFTPILKNINDVLNEIIRGGKPDSVANNVRACANVVYALLPGDTMNNACFPFIAPRGGLTGGLIEFNSDNDSIYNRAEKINKQVSNQRKKNKKEIEEAVKTLNQVRERIVNYVADYFERRPNKKQKLEALDKDQIAKMIVFYIGSTTNNMLRESFNENLAVAEKNKTKKLKEDTLIETFINDYLKVKRNANSKAKNKKPVKVSSPFADAAYGLNIDFRTQIETEEKMEVEDEDDQEDEK